MFCPEDLNTAWRDCSLDEDAEVFHIFAHLKFAHGFASSVTRSLIF